MMKFYTALVLMAILSAASGLRCYVCADASSCQQRECPQGFDRCSTVELNGVQVKNCLNNNACADPVKCCEGDLCNGAIPTGSSILLLLLSSAIMTVFL